MIHSLLRESGTGNIYTIMIPFFPTWTIYWFKLGRFHSLLYQLNHQWYVARRFVWLCCITILSFDLLSLSHFAINLVLASSLKSIISTIQSLSISLHWSIFFPKSSNIISLAHLSSFFASKYCRCWEYVVYSHPLVVYHGLYAVMTQRVIFYFDLYQQVQHHLLNPVSILSKVYCFMWGCVDTGK